MNTLRRVIITTAGVVVQGVRRVACWLRLRKPQWSAFVMASDTNISTIMDEAMTMNSRHDAECFFNRIVDWSLLNWNVPGMDCDRPNAIKLTKKNLRYWCGKCQHNREAWSFIYE